MGRLLGQGRTLHQAYRLAGYRGSPSGQAADVARHPEVRAERDRVMALAEAQALAAAVLTRREALETAARVARGQAPTETVTHESTRPDGTTARRVITRSSPLDAVRLAADLEGWTQPPGAGQQVQIQIVVDGRPAGVPRGPIRLGDGRIVGGVEAPASLPGAGERDTAPGGDGQIVLPVGVAVPVRRRGASDSDAVQGDTDDVSPA